MGVFLVGFLITISHAEVQAESVKEWWGKCSGNGQKNTCLSESELSKFKTICSNKIYKEDCQKVIDYSIARTRALEAKNLLLGGYENQLTLFTSANRYLNNSEKIWNKEVVDKAKSFVVGVLPKCNISKNKKLLFGENLRADVKADKEDILKVYSQLESLSCPDSKEGFVLVVIGKVFETLNDYEIFTIDEKKNLKIIRTSLGQGPFVSRADGTGT